MLNVCVEMPLGNQSRGYNFADERPAKAAFTRLVSQIRSWKTFAATVVMSVDSIEVQRERINADR